MEKEIIIKKTTWKLVRKEKCNNKVHRSPVHPMCKAGLMVRRINGVNEGERGERVIAKARECRMGGCTGASRGWGIRERGKVI